MARINLSIPDGIKQEMDGIDGINWSSVAAEAFQEVITRNKPRGDSMNEIKERLMASKARYEKEMMETGETYGRDWAKESAEYEDLLRLRKSEASPESVRELVEQIVDDPTDGYDFNETLRLIFGHFWETEFQKYDNPHFCAGFVKGALDLLEEAMAA